MRALAAVLFVGAILAVASFSTAQPPGGGKGEKKDIKGGDKGGKGDKGGFPGGPGMKGGPALGQVMPIFVQDQLKLTDAQKKAFKELKERGPRPGPGAPGGNPPPPPPVS